MGRTKKYPNIIGRDVPIARTSKNSDVFPGKIMWDMLENKNADSPNPDMTSPLAVARYKREVSLS